MGETCPLANELCFVTDGLQRAGIACEPGNPGEVCGPALALLNTHLNRERFQALDGAKPIVAAFTIRNIPDVQAPAEIRDQWVGVEVPVRDLDRAQSGVVELSPTDAVYALRANARHFASEQLFRILRPTMDYPVDMQAKGLEFKTADGELIILEKPQSSVDFYGRYVKDPELRMRLGALATTST